jgi:hypothetical protein
MQPPRRIILALETCPSCPVQWDLYDTEGSYYYLRYRHGHFSVDPDPGTEQPDFYREFSGDPDMNIHDLVQELEGYFEFEGCAFEFRDLDAEYNKQQWIPSISAGLFWRHIARFLLHSYTTDAAKRNHAPTTGRNRPRRESANG